MPDVTQPRRYSRLLASHGYGHALLEPISTESIRPGSCGYINDEGAWNPIIDLNDTATLAKLGITSCPLERAPRSTRAWGPKTSSTVKQSSVSLKGDVSLLQLGIPADVGAVFEYEIYKDEGAILLTTPPVIKESLYHEEPFKRWVKENARIIAFVWPDVLVHGLLIVTSTHSTREAQLNMLNSCNQKVSVGFNAGFVPVGEIAPSTEWHTSSIDSGWVGVSADQDEDGKVVFFGGIYFRWPFGRISTGHTKPVAPAKWKQHFRSAEEDKYTITVPGSAEDSGSTHEDSLSESFDIVCSKVGTDKNRLADEIFVTAGRDDDEDF